MRIEVYQGEQFLGSEECEGAVELGRRSVKALPDSPQLADPIPPDKQASFYVWKRAEGRHRVIIARWQEDTISRQHALLIPLAADLLLLKNLSTTQGIGLPESGVVLLPGESREIPLPAQLRIGDKIIRVQEEESGPVQTLSGQTPAPGRGSPATSISAFLTCQPNTDREIEMEALVGWLQTAMTVLQSAATSADFFDEAAQALVDRIGLQTGWVLLWKDNDWHVEAVRSASGALRGETSSPSKHLLNQIRTTRRTSWMEPALKRFASLGNVQVVVAAPILDRQGEVIGALYGDRRDSSLPARRGPISRIEAMLVELLASGVAAGLARLTQEKVALATRIQFEQFFSPELTQELALRPNLLEGKEEEVTVLFADLRGFCRVSDHLGPSGTVELLYHLFSDLSECVRQRQGVLVDYVGDELIAMFGAPKPMAEHPWQAAQAALEMVRRMDSVNKLWASKTGEPLSVGIGINTGIARVGNVGSRYKFKYGPLGPMVNIGSRVQGVTRYLNRPLLVTAATWSRLEGRCAGRRLGLVRVINVSEPIEIYELVDSESPGWGARARSYEEALGAFEKRDFLGAAQRLGALLAAYPEDGPIRVLLMRAMQALQLPVSEVDLVWELPSK